MIASTEEPERVSRQTPAQPIIVGVDFGTSSTKVAFRDYSDPRRKPVVLDFGTTGSGRTRFGLPSIVAVNGGRVLVGNEATAVSGMADKWVRSPKMRVARRDARSDHDSDLTDEIAAALLVGTALRTLRDATAAAEGPWEDRRIYYRMDVPLSYMEGGPVTQRFRRILAKGIEFSEELPHQPYLTDAVELWRAPVDEWDLHQELVPESHALMLGLSAFAEIPRERPHAVFDVGAGTVDMAVFVKLPGRTAYWSKATWPAGVEDLIEMLCEAVGQDGRRADEVFEALLAFEEDGRSREYDGFTLGHWDVRHTAYGFADRCLEKYTELFGDAYAVQQNTDEWRNLPVIVLGGGTLVPWLPGSLAMPPHDCVREHDLILLEGGFDGRVVGASQTDPERRELAFLVPAIGLSFAGPGADGWIPPEDIPPDPGPIDGPTGPYDWEIGDT